MTVSQANTASNVTLNEAFPFFNWRLLFYLIHPKEIPDTDNIDDIPNYANQVVLVFLLLMVGEWAVKYYYTGSGFRVNDTITSVGAGLASQTLKFLTRSMDVVVYMWIFDHWRVWTVPLRSWLGWGLAFLAADLAYYWLHRANHEVSILWASHQTHHSSEEYNLSTALRQSMIGGLYGWVVYLPMAFLGFTPVAHVVHAQLNTLYQFWIHTAMIKNLGPLEWILNTPSHHRVHHGRNPYCIDKNYAGALIIWDRMFGTFEPEHQDESVVYGIITPVASFNGIWVQFNTYISIISRLSTFKSLNHKLKSLYMGPGWRPGTKRLGNPEDIPAIESPIRVFEVSVPAWKTLYAFVHFVVLVVFFKHAAAHYNQWGTVTVWTVCFAIMITLGNVGSVLDDRKWIPMAELARCGVLGLMISKGAEVDLVGAPAVALRTLFALSAMLWTGCLTKQLAEPSQKRQ
ncbi:Alkylglycerol monooxygenase [Hypsibius exemplaris]|uniref:Alkylglycerol monooxygenase n=1 Tax=Hypsibius exemplaris TaxID=2072580 RepID=A0A1W0WMG8_HYPEX|nr:Alkylglycerol monooxygenase [Hypsibius exemplaris]